MQLTHEMLDRLDQLEKKYGAMGQDMQSYLDGLLYADYLTYWDYIHLDTLLSLQNARTPIPDERIFIIYHQITELYFRLILDAIEQLGAEENLEINFFKRQIRRMNTYFEQLIQSFDIMVEGMDKDEFLRFRMSLLPASGFQSVQYRQIEFSSTDLRSLVHHSRRSELTPDADFQTVYQDLYWRFGATELATGKKTLTLRQFEQKYSKSLLDLASRMRTQNVNQCFQKLPEADRQDTELVQLLRQYDFNANVQWRLAHYRSAIRYLERKPQTIAATGGTNWQEYLPPKNQRILFFPQLWTEEEFENWGRKTKM